ncbi:unnamed protein product [Orchesella dallaii]|uniref:BTB domain-containing protein n=1 Tax=Orchesella dallaii TaxID=48710 RepID=A0ABP1PY83_9HEXA
MNQRRPKSASKMSYHLSYDGYLSQQPYTFNLATQNAKPPFASLFRVGKSGVNLEEQLFEYWEGDSCLNFFLGDYSVSARHFYHGPITDRPSRRHFYLGNNFWIIALKNRKPGLVTEKLLMIVFGLCDCTACQCNYWIETMNLEPVNLDLKCITNGNNVFDVTGEFYPGCTENYVMGMCSKKNNTEIFYYRFFRADLTAIAPLLPIFEFYRNLESYWRKSRSSFSIEFPLRPPSIKVAGLANATTSTGEAMNQDGINSLPDEVFDPNTTDLTIVSLEGNVRHCHMHVLKAGSTVMDALFSDESQMAYAGVKFINGGRRVWRFEAKTVIVDVILQWFYLKNYSIVDCDLKTMMGILRLAHHFRMLDLLPTVARNIKRKISKSSLKDIENLLTLLRSQTNIEVLARLNLSVEGELKSRKPRCKLVRVPAAQNMGESSGNVKRAKSAPTTSTYVDSVALQTY